MTDAFRRRRRETITEELRDITTGSEAARLTHGPGSSAPWRITADDAFSRIVAAPLVPGNSVRLLKDSAENYPAWLEAIAVGQHWIHFESYIMGGRRAPARPAHLDVLSLRGSPAVVSLPGARVRPASGSSHFPPLP